MTSTDARSLRRFGVEAAVIFELLALWLWLRKHHPHAAFGVAGGGLIWPLMALVWPAALAVVRRRWLAVGRAVGTVNAWILLSVIYFALLTPIAVLRRWFGKKAPTGWRRVEPRARDHFDRPY